MTSSDVDGILLAVGAGILVFVIVFFTLRRLERWAHNKAYERRQEIYQKHQLELNKHWYTHDRYKCKICREFYGLG